MRNEQLQYEWHGKSHMKLFIDCYHLIVRLLNHAYSLCNFNNLQMSDKYVKPNCYPNKILVNKGDIFAEISYITNVSSVRIYIGITIGYTTQF